MKIVIQRGGVLDGTRAEADDLAYVVVLANDDTPLLAIEQVGRDHVQVTRATDSTFPTILARLGVQQARTMI